MKGQFIFEFLVAGLIFFAIIVYTINYLSVNVSVFKTDFHQNRLQTKAFQISEILMEETPLLGLTQNGVFSQEIINNFNNRYCDAPGSYKTLTEDLHLYEKTYFGVFTDNIKIDLFTGTQNFIDCGPVILRNVTKAEMARIGVLGGETASLRVVVW